MRYSFQKNRILIWPCEYPDAIMTSVQMTWREWMQLCSLHLVNEQLTAIQLLGIIMHNFSRRKMDQCNVDVPWGFRSSACCALGTILALSDGRTCCWALSVPFYQLRFSSESEQEKILVMFRAREQCQSLHHIHHHLLDSCPRFPSKGINLLQRPLCDWHKGGAWLASGCTLSLCVVLVLSSAEQVSTSIVAIFNSASSIC